MRRPWLEMVLGGLLFGLTGCGGDPPAPRDLSAEEEQEFDRQQKEARQGESRVRE